MPSEFARLKPSHGEYLNRPQDFKDQTFNAILGQSLNNVNINRDELHRRTKTRKSLMDDDEDLARFGTAHFDSVSSIHHSQQASGPGLNQSEYEQWMADHLTKLEELTKTVHQNKIKHKKSP